MDVNRIVEYTFFFMLLALAGWLVWLVLSPFLPALALAAAAVIICYPVYERILRYTPRHNKSLASALSTLVVLILIIIPVLYVSSVVVSEAVSFYRNIIEADEFFLTRYLGDLESFMQTQMPGFELNLTDQFRQGAQWFVGNLGAIFAGTATTLFMLLLSIVGMFYLFRDGWEFTRWLVRVSPLPDMEDEVILSRLALAVRSVVTGVVLVSIIQGVAAAVGFSLFGIDRAILWASIAAIAALLPGIGTMVIMVPAIIYLFVIGNVLNAIGLLIWAAFAVVLIDNFVGPYLMSRGNKLHPFLILLSVLGGIAMFGPIGFVIGPVLVSLFMVLLELYGQNMVFQPITAVPKQKNKRINK